LFEASTPNLGGVSAQIDASPATGGRGPALSRVAEVGDDGRVSDFPPALRSIVRSHDLKVIDKRAGGGALWVVAESDFGKHLRPFGFQFAKTGGKATGHRPAWFLHGKPKPF